MATKYKLKFSGEEVDNLLTKIDNLPENVSTLKFEIVSELPEIDIDISTIYLVKTESDDYEEFIYINNEWEMLGTTKLNLDDYATKDYVNEIVSPIATKGVNERLIADSPVFTVTSDMIGKRIVCKNDFGRMINLPAPPTVEEGSIVEIEADIGNNGNYQRFCEVFTSEGNIIKGTYSGNKCIQPGNTVRKYYCDGVNWITDFCKIDTNNKLLVINIDNENGSDTELVVGRWGWRSFKEISTLNLFKEYPKIRIDCIGEVTLKENLMIENMTVKFYEGTLIIPKDFKITLDNTNLFMYNITLCVENIGFLCSGIVNVMLGDYVGMNIKPISNNPFHLFDFINFQHYEPYSGNMALNLLIARCTISGDNLEEFTADCNIIRTGQGNLCQKPAIFIEQSSMGWGSKPDNVKWYNNSDALSRIGTSTLYTVG